MHINTECKRVMWKKRTREPGGHDRPDDRYFANMRDNIRRFADLGLEVWITEMSVDVDPAKPLEQQLDRQAEIYRRLFEVCLDNLGMKGIKLWGIMDDVDRVSGQRLRPYLFDDRGRAKPAFYAVQQSLAKKPATHSR